MFVGGACSIYERRPRTCRTYDCRVFTAAGVSPDDDKPLIAAQVSRWEFTYAAPADRHRHETVRAVAVQLRSVNGVVGEPASVNATRLAVNAIERDRQSSASSSNL